MRRKPQGFLVHLESFEEAVFITLQNLIQEKEYNRIPPLVGLLEASEEVARKTTNLDKDLSEFVGNKVFEIIARKALADSKVRHKKYCGFKDCPYRQQGLGYCQGHLEQLRNKEELTPLINYRRVKRKCLFTECPYPHSSKGYCDGHVKQLREGRELAPLKKRTRKGRICSEPGCSNSHVAKGYCKKDYEKYIVRGNRTRDKQSVAVS